MVSDLFFVFISSSVSLILPLLIRTFINSMINKNERHNFVLNFLVGSILLILLKFISDYFTVYVGHMIGIKIEGKMRQDLFEHCQKMSYAFYDKKHTGQMISLFTNDIANISEILHHGPETLFLSFIKFIGAFWFLIQLNLQMALGSLAIIFLIIALSKYGTKKSENIFKYDKEMFSKVVVRLEENLMGIKTVKAFSNELEEIEKFKKANQTYILNKDKMYRFLGIYYSGTWALTSLIIPAVISIMYLFSKEFCSLPNLLTAVLYLDIIVQAIFNLLGMVEQIEHLSAGLKRFIGFLEQEVEINSKQPITEPYLIKGNIVFQDVEFNYSIENDSKAIFKKLNLIISAGSHLVLIGKSGSGKTTLCNLIPRFYEIDSGNIYIDNNNIKNMKISDLRKHIGILSQQNYIFSGTISDNIRYGKLNATKEEIEQAAKNAYIHEQITTMPNGYNTYIGQNGANLSEGQKQRIAIARLFLKNPRIIIIDEATSALDSENEFFIFQALENLAKNKTMITILHKLYMIKPTDRILVLDNGEIKEDGTHNELLCLDGLYAKLYNHIYN